MADPVKGADHTWGCGCYLFCGNLVACAQHSPYARVAVPVPAPAPEHCPKHGGNAVLCEHPECLMDRLAALRAERERLRALLSELVSVADRLHAKLVNHALATDNPIPAIEQARRAALADSETMDEIDDFGQSYRDLRAERERLRAALREIGAAYRAYRARFVVAWSGVIPAPEGYQAMVGAIERGAALAEGQS